ncbi:hypothetical protein C8F04DRAFT_1067011 [Mycena alexandri]|uniref:Uncharacterized protein n=1 Tax=Mycena alexandri TaxID=1745969 RepID=A0AAD6TGX0_9AGAR|nr:hypothetical protein C8F04DRAFT_1067011 [Mycena alexandri]
MPSLPLELQREIVEIAIRNNYKNRAVKSNLRLVAHRVHFWVDQILYESVRVINGQDTVNFLNAIDSKPVGFFATAVKMLDLHYVTTDTIIARILAACGGVRTLAFWSRVGKAPPLDRLPLRRLTMPLELVSMSIHATTEPIWLSSLTHLDIGFASPKLPDMALTDILRRLPHLTHLALDLSAADPVCAASICTDCPCLRILVIFTSQFEDAACYQDAYSFDPRIVTVKQPSDLKNAKDWEAARLGLPDFWTRAENVVNGRRARAAAQSTQ